METYGYDWCGSNYGPRIEIQSGNGATRRTYWQAPFSKGTTLEWSNRNGKLGGVSGFQVTPYVDKYFALTHYYINIRIIAGGKDQFCPRNIYVYTYGGTIYEYSFGSPRSPEWVGKGQGEGKRRALKMGNLK